MIYEDYFKSVIGGNFKSPEYYNTTYENKTYEPIQVNGTIDNNLNVDNVIDLYPDIYKVVLPMVDKMLLGKNTSNLNDTILNTWTLEIYDSLEAEDNVKQPNRPINQVYESENTSVKPLNKVGNITDSRVENSNQKTNVNQSTKLSQATNLNPINNLSKSINLSQSSNFNQSTNLNQTKITNNSPIKNVNNYVKNDKSVNSISNSSIETNAETLKENQTVDVVSRYHNRKNPILRDLIKIMILNRLFGNNYNNRPPRIPYPNYERENYNPRLNYQVSNNVIPNYQITDNSMADYQISNNSISNNQAPIYKPVDVNPYSKYLKNKPKTYFDTPYPEEG